MRVSARLDATRSKKLESLTRSTDQSSAEVIRPAIDLYYAQETEARSSGADILRAVGFVGVGEASPDLASNYKSGRRGPS